MALNPVLGVGRDPAVLPIRINYVDTSLSATGSQTITRSISATSSGRILSAQVVVSNQEINNPNGKLTCRGKWNDQIVGSTSIIPNSFVTNFGGAGTIFIENFNMLSGSTCTLGDTLTLEIVIDDGSGICQYRFDNSLTLVYQES